MAATTDTDRLRLTVENVLANLAEADDSQRVALMRLVQRARTQDEADIITEILTARQAVTRAKTVLMTLHRTLDPYARQ